MSVYTPKDADTRRRLTLTRTRPDTRLPAA
jgi:hypothetical protein